MSNNILTNDFSPFQKFKVLAHYDRMVAIKNNKFMPPVNIALDLLSGTNDNKLCGSFKCKMCMSDLCPEDKPYRIPHDILFQIPNFWNEWGVKSVCLAGSSSDPLIFPHDELIDFLYELKKYNIDIGLVTNGAFFDDKVIKACSDTCNFVGFSVNAGSDIDHSIITNTKNMFNKVMFNMKKLSSIIKENNSKCTIGYKFLILPENQNYILQAIQAGKDNGANDFQLRPCELPENESKLINPNLVEQQLIEGLKLETSSYHVYGICEKFTNSFTKKTPKRCIVSPLGSTWKANGNVVICPDRRWSENMENMILCNFITDGLDKVKDLWGSEKHFKMIEAINKDIQNCIRCTFYSAQQIMENCVIEDKMDITLI